MPKRWREKVGGYGCTVRVEEREEPGDNVQLKAWDPETENYRKRSLGYGIRREDGTINSEARREAVAEARALSNRLDEGHNLRKRPTVERVFRLFKSEQVGPDQQGKSRRRSIKTALKFWRRFLKDDYDLSDLSRREWDAAKRDRSTGRRAADGEAIPPEDRTPVRDRAVRKTLQVLQQVCDWAYGYKPEGERNFLLETDPTRGFDLPRESDPQRPVATLEQYSALQEAAENVYINASPENRAPLREMLTIARHTGFRRSAIAALRWEDWRPETDELAPFGRLRWRAEEDKVNSEWLVPVREEVRETLEGLKSNRNGSPWIFPAPQVDGHVSGDRATKWLGRAKDEAEIEFPTRFGFHAFVRMWATERKGYSKVDVSDAGGWKDSQTLERIYQQPDPENVRDVVLLR